MKIDFDHLQQTQQKTAQIKQVRQAEALDCYDKGQRILSSAIVKKYDKALLQEAGDHFAKGISLDRKEPQNYLGLAYLLVLANQPNDAIQALKAALFLEPENKMGIHLMSKAEKALLQPKSMAMNLSVPDIELPQEEIDYDLLYDQIELDILDQVIHIMENQTGPIDPSLDNSIIQKLIEQKNDLQQIYLHIDKRLKIVEQEIDTTELRKQIRPIEIRIRQVHKAIEVSEQFIELQNHLTNQIKWTHLSISQLTEKMVPVMEKKVEGFIDQCDKIADQLDEIEAQGFNISEIETIYNNFVQSIEILQLQLDNVETTF